jgi:hypothetical protein
MLLLNDISMLCELHDLQNDTAIDSVDIILEDFAMFYVGMEVMTYTE